MARPLRIEFPGAIYHVTSRGDRRDPIFVDDIDRAALLTVLARATQRFDAQVLAYCLMGHHYHLVCTHGKPACPCSCGISTACTRSATTAGTARLGMSSRGASRRFWWIVMPTCWCYAAMSS